MKLNRVQTEALLLWINSVFPDEPFSQFIHMRDGQLLLKICYKLQGKEECEKLKTLPLHNKVQIIFSYLHNDFDFSRRQSSLISQRISQSINLELQLAKVALLLCYCSFKKDNLATLSTSTESVIESLFRFVKEDADGLSLDEGLDQFLTQDSVRNFSSCSVESSASSSFYTDEEFPLFSRFPHPPRVQFQDLCTVASSSDGSPVQDTMSTPHFQLKKLRKELAHEGDVRDELEKELANQISIISEKEGLISQLQHRVERLLREQGELEKDHKAALLELQEKNESLLHRVHEVLKQCQALKSDNSQKEKKIDELTEENGSLAAQVRNMLTQLSRAEEEVAKLTLAHESSEAEWKNRREFLEKELNEAVTHRECLSEQVQILQGKISVLEDELQKAQTQERGEVLGPVMEWEKLKQELADLTLKLAQLQDTISCLKKEKTEVEALLAEERDSFEQETRRLQTVVFDLEESISSIRMEREILQQTSQAQKEMLTAQIEALECDVSRLQQVEVQLTAEIKISADLRQQRGELEGKVASLDKIVNALHSEIQVLEMERSSQQDSLNVLIIDLQGAKATLCEYEKKLENHQNVVEENDSLKREACTLQKEINEQLQAIGDLHGQISFLEQDKKGEETKVNKAMIQIESLQIQISQLSEQISLKDEEIRNLSDEYDSLDRELKHVKKQNVEINEMINSICKDHEETVKKLQQELCCAALTVTEKREEVIVLSAEVMCLKEQICHYSENDLQKQQEFSVLEAERNVLKETLTSLQNQLAEATSATAQKESELLLLQQEFCQQETVRKKAQELETDKCEEFNRKVNELQAKILEVSTLASEREAQVNSLQDEMKGQQLRAKQIEYDLLTKLEEKVGSLQGELNAAVCVAADKEHLLESLEQKLREVELLCQQKEKDVLETNQAKENLEKRISELHVEKQQLNECQQNLDVFRKERDHLSAEVTSLKEELCSCQDIQVRKQQEMSALEVEHNMLKENLAALNNKLVEVTTTALQKESELMLLQNELRQQESLKEHAQELEKNMNELQDKVLEVSTLASEREAQISTLHNEVKNQQLRAKQSKDDLCREVEEKMGILQRQLETASCDAAKKDCVLQSLDRKLREMKLLCQQKENDILEAHQAKVDLEKRVIELCADKQRLEEHQQNLGILKKERDHLFSLSQSLQRECDASQRIRAELELKVEEQSGSISALKKAGRQWEEKNQELLEQLKTKSDAIEHYKAQVEKAKTHYTSKKQLLVEAQEMNKSLEHSLEASKREVKALETELTLARMELDQVKTKEKNLVAKVNSLEAQVDFANRQLREQKLNDDVEEVRHRESLYIRVPETRQDNSTDSLELELNDSLNTNSRSAIPSESSTPLVRSSERLAAKRRALGTESLETLYFTPMSQHGNKQRGDCSEAFEHKLETSITSFGDLVVDSAKKLTASARRRRTTQVINITMAKKTSGTAERGESFSSLHSARSQPNLAVQHSRPVSMDLSEEDALSKTEKLQSLPGYRRSAVHNIGPTRATSTFCIGAENEPEHAPDDWMRIAELQARNKACLPHLKSSYPLESRPSLGLPSFTITDDDLRMGDPDDTIRRASMIPGQILDSLNSRRFSLALGTGSSQAHAQSQPQRSTMLPGQIRSSIAAHRASQLTKTSNKRTSENTRSPLAHKRPGSQLQGPDTPEAKKLSSCFPRPMTPKGRNANSQNRPPNSPAERRQSVMFTVVNTPKTNSRGDSRLQRGLNKLRNSARKSPAAGSRALRSAANAVNGRSPLDSALRKSPRNRSPKSSAGKKMKFRIKV